MKVQGELCSDRGDDREDRCARAQGLPTVNKIAQKVN